MDKVPMTKQGHADLEAELKDLKSVKRPNIIAAIAEAREHGDLSENAEYHAAREQQSFIEGRIAELENCLSRANVIDVSTMSGSSVKFGATVEYVDCDTDEEQTYQIVGDLEASLERGTISISSPLARALIGKEEGDEFEFQSPSGVKNYEILSIAYK